MIVGIDPGKSGGIVCIESEIKYYTIPKIGDEIDVLKLNEIISELKGSSNQEHHIFIEKVHALYKSSAKSTFTFGHVCGLLEGITVANGIPHTMVQPKEWQKEMFQGITAIKKPGKKTNDTKKMAEIAYKRLFPQLDLYITDNMNKSKKVHDGIVDALLIAEYGRRKLK